ncbi:hypothetical protein RND81_09G024500 [Saponaria officinalis]|uniref:Small G protein signalling modulator 1/2 Rab-binding domain-containing protein n=1 Tax=Saponaria officinalis TaxID=3572 RepID=A0AAW1IH23_SAPOF
MVVDFEERPAVLGINLSQMNWDLIKLRPGEDFGVKRKYSRMGVIKENGFWMPVDEETRKSLGYYFIEFNTPQEAELAKERTRGHGLDKAHFFAVNLFEDIEKYMKVLDEWAPPEMQPYKPTGSYDIMRSDSGRRSEPEGAEVLYARENVSIHPTQYMSERISGRLKLIKQKDSLFMTWIPYKGQNTNARLSERDRNLYTIRPLPFTDVRSIRRHTLALGWQYIIVVLSSGLAFPPLYFYNGGVKEFLATIKQHVSLSGT